MAEAAGIILAVPGIIDLCIEYGQFLKEKVVLYRQMGDIVRLERFVVQLVLTLRYVRSSFHGNKSIKKASAELEQWHTRFLRRAVVFLFFGGHDIVDAPKTSDGQNRAISRIKRIRQAMIDDDAEEVSRIQLDDVDTTSFQRLDDSQMYVSNAEKELVEYRLYELDADAKKTNTIRVAVRDFAAKLRKVDPSTMGLLACSGYSVQPVQHRFALHFQCPAGKTNPHTLQHLLSDKANRTEGVRFSKSDQINLARKLVSAVLYLHSCGFVHKNIRPPNILIFEPVASVGADSKTTTYPYAVGEPYLIGFDSVRKADAHSSMIRVEEWEKNIYLHPHRHRMAEGDEFTMRHDIYSLGVVLLEISVWRSFTDRGGIGKYLWERGENGKPKLLSPEQLKERFIAFAKSQVPRTMGNRYLDVVVACLEGLRDEEEEGLLEDQDGIVVGLAYITQIMGRLEEICM